MCLIVFFSIISYLIGSFSSAFWFGKWFKNIDIRQFGSKNAGATNACRIVGFKIGILAFTLDAMKSFIAVQLIYFVPNIIIDSEAYFQIKILFGICAVVGHIFPIYSSFKGGKGVASMFGIFFGLTPFMGLIAFAVFIILIFLTRIISLSSICSAIVYPILIYTSSYSQSITLTVFSVLSCFLIIVTHRKNIERLIKKEEKKLF
ncbi:glycerol-3-phosphate 1-O-acyltransferase PlsY [Bacteroides sp. 519]|uniref:glycerol-3-phosphate 1-O-acyltransferase PlsY n=1 Tax=Bacteroides sp. 519 TaxID=2302937 RepID=UPI00210626A5|nr:glycerol-3-phosphate 1-O-acyltransferase PlsY [Bacteroides sp. 519]NDV56788.1 glycerol-3-phosphate 1-O-acyltransferase [Bacteroides sp. 519]